MPAITPYARARNKKAPPLQMLRGEKSASARKETRRERQPYRRRGVGLAHSRCHESSRSLREGVELDNPTLPYSSVPFGGNDRHIHLETPRELLVPRSPAPTTPTTASKRGCPGVGGACGGPGCQIRSLANCWLGCRGSGIVRGDGRKRRGSDPTAPSFARACWCGRERGTGGIVGYPVERRRECLAAPSLA